MKIKDKAGKLHKVLKNGDVRTKCGGMNINEPTTQGNGNAGQTLASVSLLGLCRDCKHWNTSDINQQSKRVGFQCGECHHAAIEFQGPYVNPGAGPHDHDSYGGYLMTSACFGCVLFEHNDQAPMPGLNDMTHSLQSPALLNRRKLAITTPCKQCAKPHTYPFRGRRRRFCRECIYRNHLISVRKYENSFAFNLNKFSPL